MMSRKTIFPMILAASLLAAPVGAQVAGSTISGLGARNIGSAAMSGRIAAIAGVVALVALNPISVLCWYPNGDDHAASVLRRAGAKVRRTPRLLWLSTLSQAEILPYGDVWDLELNNVTIDDNLASNMASLRSLDHLGITNCRLEGSSTNVGPPVNMLRIVYIGDSNAGDTHIAFLAGSPHLQFLMLKNTEISDVSIPVILSCKRLTYIFLKNNKFSQEGIQRIRTGFPKANVVS